MMKLLQKIPFFLLLLVLFFCLHGGVENYGFISFKEIIKPGLIILAFVLMVTGLVYLFTKNLLHAALIVFFISLWYLFFGALHDWIKGVSFLSVFKTYTAITILLLVASIAWILFLKYRKSFHNRLALYLNILLLVYCLVDLYALGKNQFSKSAAPIAENVNFDTSRVTQKPDIYFLLFDGYPGFTSLKDSFNFTNERLNTYFTEHSFKVLPVFSNYDYTYFSMSSMFNLQYVYDDYENMNLKQRDFQKRGVEINRGAIFPIFKSMGYTIKNLSIFEIDDKPALSNENSFLLAHAILLTDKIFHKRLVRDIGDRLEKIIPFWRSTGFYQHDIENKLAEELLLKTAKEKIDKPKYVYAHFMMPHGPYYFDSAGNKNPYEKISHFTMWKDKALFVSYIEYVNKKIFNMTDTIISHNPNAIVIVMGDHGFRSYKFDKVYQPLRFDNLCAVRFPNNGHKEVRSKWSNVNLYRYLFNCQFGQSMPYLADSSIVLNYK